MVANRDLVVVGASAGGVEALRELVSGLPADLDAAVLVVLHLPPGGATALDSILDRCGPLPCAPAEDGAPLRRGTVVVGRPDRHLRVVGDRIVLDRGPSEGGHRPSVDALFRSAARARGPRTTGVVLSGVLDDGAAGLVGIARAGGRVVLQDPADALHPGMPHGALRLLVPDHVSPARDIGPLLGRIAREPAEPVLPDTGGNTDELDRALWAAYRVLNDRAALAARLEGATDHTMSTRHGDARREAELLAGELRTLLLGGLPAGAPRRPATERGPAGDRDRPRYGGPGEFPSPDEDAEDAVFETLLAHVHESRAFDFTGYKRASLKRRFRHRMAQIGVGTYDEYLDLLQVNPDEFPALFDTVLINVTGFFRDPDTWDFLRDTAVPEMLAAVGDEAPVRVWSVGCASGEEAYTLAIVLCEILGTETFRTRVKIYATDVDEDALTTARQATYSTGALEQVPEDLRSRYFEAQGDRWTFRKDLRRSVIFGRNDLVQDAPISRIDLLVCRNTLMYFTPPTQAAVLGRFQFALAPAGILVLGRAEMLLTHGNAFEPIDLRRRVFRAAPGARSAVAAALVPSRRTTPGGVDELREHAADELPVAQIVLTDDDVLAIANRRADELLGVGTQDVGRALRDLDVSYRPVELRSVVDRVRTERAPQRITDVELTVHGGEQVALEVRVDPLVDGNGRLLGVSVAFIDVTATRRLGIELEHVNRQLESSYEDLQSTSEELETTNEELQSTVEELETTNEELQSTNEELETMNEELRSTNDELQRINDDVRDHNDEIDRLNDFLESILGSLRSAVIVLDTGLRVIVWNTGAEELWGLRRDEAVGEHLLSLDIGLPVDLLRPALRGTSDGDDAELTVTAVNRRGRTVEVRITTNPLRRPDGSIAGAVLVMD